MAAPSQYYVDPAAGDDADAGGLDDPWATVQHALDTIAQDAANGDQINIKAGTDDVLSAALNLTTYGTPVYGAPLILRGYTAAANDGGIGGLDGDGGAVMNEPTSGDFLIFIDLHMHNAGTADILTVDDNNLFINCEVDNTTGNGITCGAKNTAIGCHLHNIGTDGLNFTGQNNRALFNYFANGANDFTNAIDNASDFGVLAFNIMNLDGASTGIDLDGVRNLVFCNSIFSNAGTGEGINNDNRDNLIFNNLIEGFSGVGGVGISDIDDLVALYGHNALYNNDTHTAGLATILEDLGNTDELTASPFVDAAGADFRARPFAQVRGDGWPASWAELALGNFLDKGALQRRESSRRTRAQRIG